MKMIGGGNRPPAPGDSVPRCRYLDNQNKLIGGSLIIQGAQPHGALIETDNDHRIAMSFALAGLKIPASASLTRFSAIFSSFW